ncbi:hypothetical protein OS493_008372 [Desmophyllum pertusum]|uniref:PHD-type domain-containing protein n=1 Tax=Desmophyllum pertusum TaxID=174260 RepID=A0A9X0DCK0_9CNID|nr:hypothetical protein OS493_008372 [Desmophyllum pertusum]
MEERDSKPSLRDLEIDFLKEKLAGFSVEEQYCFGHFDGNRVELEDILDTFQFARCLCEGLDVNGNFNVAMERERVTSIVFGSCYDDLHERNTAVCKVCKDDDGEDWLGCDACGQFFHASCFESAFLPSPSHNISPALKGALS